MNFFRFQFPESSVTSPFFFTTFVFISSKKHSPLSSRFLRKSETASLQCFPLPRAGLFHLRQTGLFVTDMSAQIRHCSHRHSQLQFPGSRTVESERADKHHPGRAHRKRGRFVQIGVSLLTLSVRCRGERRRRSPHQESQKLRVCLQ